METVDNCHFRVGKLTCIAINDRIEHFPVDTIVKDVAPEDLRQALLEAGCSPTENLSYYNLLYIEQDAHRILIDVGWGKDIRPFGGVTWQGALVDHLQSEGISPTDIDTVIITHGDPDHILGIANLKNELVFPNATYILLKEAWEFWSNDGNSAQWPAPLTVFGRKMLPLIRDRIKVIEAGSEFLPGFELIPAFGHRPGHTAVTITSAGERLLHLADTVGNPILMSHPSWHGHADFRHDEAGQDRIRLLRQASLQQALVFGSHLPFPGVGHVTPQGEGWRWQLLQVSHT